MALMGLAAALLPGLANACPMCASQQPGGAARIVALGLMILLPFSIAFVVFRVLRRAGGAAAEAPPGSSMAGANTGPIIPSVAPDGRARSSAMRELSP
jgi:hypothetical protein